ncbi:hypothetical protein [Methylobacterium sp. Leaf456]|uniref:hypothetical protein n=1 Tax=Methylobacterium sp. Leaf456 TaxID=1736382 RepID=UPI000A6AD3CA|nr:hypothetical protein [Methylobacterium sp. Leaf456]
MSALSRFPRLMRFQPNGCDLLATTALTLGLGCLCAGPALAQTASGGNATAVGPNSTASGHEAVAGGYNANAPGARSVAIGSGANAESATTNQGIINYRDGSRVGNRSAGTDGDIATGANGTSTPPNEPNGSAGAIPTGTAIGANAKVGSGGGVAVGMNNTAGMTGFNSTAIGVDNDAAGRFSTAIGYGNIASGRSTLSFGTNNLAQGDSAIAMGRQSYAIGDFSFAQGFVTSAYGTDAIALGSLAVAGEASGTPTKGNVAIGDRSTALGGSAVALGSGASAGSAGSVAIGAGSVASRAVGNRNELFSGTGLTSANTEFSVGSVGSERQITNVAGGTADTDAVNVRQLRSVGGSLATTIGSSFDPVTGTYAPPAYRYGGATFDTVPGVIQAIDDFGLRYDRDGSGNPTNSIDLTRGRTVGGGGTVAISGLSAGAVNTASTDAINGSQLYGTANSTAAMLGGSASVNADGTLSAPRYTVQGTTYRSVGEALVGTDQAISTHASNIATNTTNLSDLRRTITDGTIGLVQQDAASRALTVGSATDGTQINFAGTAGPRRLSGLADGVVDSDAATLGQLRLSGGALANGLGGGASYDPATGTLSGPTYSVGGKSYDNVGAALAATNGLAVQYVPDANGEATNTIDLARGGPRGPASLRGVANGRVVAGSTDAVNGGQLFTTNQAVAANAGNIATNTTNLTDLRRTITDGTIGLVQQDPTSRTVTVAAATGGTQVNFAGTAGNRRLSGLADGVADSDAATLGQLRLSGGALASGFGGGAIYDPATGTLSGPRYSVGGQSYDNVGAALAATNGLSVQYVPDANGAATRTVDLARGNSGGAVALQGVANGRLAAGSTDAVNGGQLNDTNAAVAQLSSAVGTGNLGLVRQDAASRGLTVGAGTDGTSVSFANGTGQARVLGGVAAGSVAAGSLEAVNGSQLRGSVASVAAALGGGAKVGADGTLSAPAYTVQGRSYGNVGAALTATDRAVTTNTTAIAGNTAAIAAGATQLAALETGLDAGTVGLLRRDPTDGSLTIGAQANGTTLKLANKDGRGRTVSGVAAGRLASGSTEAVNGDQLFETNNAVARLTSEVGSGTLGLVRQDPTSRLITVGGATDGRMVSLSNAAGDARQLTGLADGRVAAGSRDAVNGSQLATTAASTAAALGGGAKVGPDGKLGAPAYTVQGQSYGNVGTALAATDRAVSTNAAGLAATGAKVAALTTGIDKGTVGLVRQDQTGRGLTIGAETDGTTLSLANKSGQDRVVSGIAAGNLTANSTEAVNGAQLNATNQTINNLTQAVTQGTVGLVRQDATGRGLTVGADTDGTTVGFANGTGQARTLTGIADGRIAAGSREAVNGGQLQAGLAATAAALGGGAKVGADGKLIGPKYDVQGKTYGDVGSALSNLDVAVTNLTNSGSRYVAVKSTGKAAQATGGDSVAIGGGSQARAAGGVALGSGSVADRAGLRGGTEAFSGTRVASTAGAVSVGSAGAERQITHVAGGTADTDAVNVRQLKSAGNQLATVLGGGAAFGADGRLTKPSYGVKGKSYDNVGAALGALDTYGVTYDVDPASGGRGQSLTLSGGDPNKPVLIRNVADGVLATDAATFGQVSRAKAESIAYTDAKAMETLNAATGYTDKRIAPLEGQMASFGSQLADLNRQVGDVRTEARRGAAIGLAAAALRFDDRPGKLSVAAGGGVWRGESAASFGLGYTLPDGSARVNATGVTAGRDFGIGAGASFTLN